ncbi:pilus assembly protein, partial [Burkholderia multivorans]
RVGSDGGYATVTVTVRLPDAIFFLDEVEAAATARTEGGRPGGSDPG